MYIVHFLLQSLKISDWYVYSLYWDVTIVDEGLLIYTHPWRLWPLIMNSEVILSRHTYRVFWEICLFWEPSPRNNCIHIRCQELGCDTVITSLLFLFKDLGSSFPGLELQTIHMNGKRSRNWTLAVIYALRTTKPVHKYHRNYKNLAKRWRKMPDCRRFPVNFKFVR